MRFLFLILFLVMVLPLELRAEPSAAPVSPVVEPAAAKPVTRPSFTPAPPAPQAPVDPLPTPQEVIGAKQTALAILAQKLMGPDGTPVSVVLLTPMDTTAAKVGPAVAEALKNLIARYGVQNVRVKENPLKSLSMRQLRNALTDYNADILVVPVLQNTSFDLYLYDKRSPYALFAHSQPIAENAQLLINSENAVTVARLMLRRTLFRYIHEQYFELPHEDTDPYVDTEIPRWIASSQSIAAVNRDNMSRFYASVTLGAAMNVNDVHSFWNSSLMGLQLGFRPFDRFYIEASARTFSYNVFAGALKYLLMSKERSLRLSIGVGVAYVTDRKVWQTDETEGLNTNAKYLTGVATLQYPIGDIYLVIDAGAYTGIGATDYIFTVAPGILINF